MSVVLKPYANVAAGQATGRFYLGDCVAVLGQLAPQSVDVIVTSPPYNLGIQYNRYEDSLTREDYLTWTNNWLAAAARVLRPDGSLFLNVGAKPSDPWTALDVAQTARPHLRLQNIIHWIKSIAIDRSSAGAGAGLTRDLAVGHYKPINSDRFLNDCQEFVFHFTPGGDTSLDRLALGVPYQDQSNVTRWRNASQGLRCRGNTWFIPYETIQRRDRDRPHPATFPSQLPEQCLRLHGLGRVRVAMDPFTGLGSTAVACARLGINFIGADIDEVYLKEAVARMRDAGSRTDRVPETTAKGLPGRGEARMRKASLRPGAAVATRSTRAR
ncbi:MAG TPA: site-specific DNA-methyltransferase [Vicinamibacterales bacterium]|jgi:site-specific DNA-methyltransferase (adenine-specific)